MKQRVIALKIITAALFVVPALFFASVYFLQVVSSEDIHQGAGQPVSIVADASSAFHWSARFGDVYAWSVINFFDYKYEFGVDTVFRVLDVALAVGVFYLITAMVAGRRPRWEIRDALIFCASFLAVFLSDFSRSIISSFSQIHNYLFIAVFSLLFLLPFVQQLRGGNFSSSLRNRLLMLVVGFLFAFSSNVTPAAFLLTAILVIAYDRLVLKKQIHFSRALFCSWQFFAIVGVLMAFVLMYVIGPGVSSYTHGYVGTYVSIADLITAPAKSGVALIGNMVHNIQSVTPELMLMALVVLFEFVIYRKKLIVKRDEPAAGVRFSAVCFVFFVTNILAVSQIDVFGTGMSRILLPAYISAVVCVLFTVNRLLQIVAIQKKTLASIAVLVALSAGIITLDVGTVMVKHRQEATVVLDRIKNTGGEKVCVAPKDNPSAKSPLLKYHQRELFVDWAMPEMIYGKQVDWCGRAD